MHALGPVLVALTALPALGIAAWQARAVAIDPKARGLALRWAGIALSMLLGALGLYLAGDDRGRATTVGIVMVVAVNVLLVSMLLHMRGRDRR